LITISTQAFSLAVQLVGLMVLARLLGPSVYGSFAIAASFAALASALVLMGVPMAVAQSPNLSSSARSSLFFLTSALGLACGVFLALASGAISDYYHDSRLRNLLFVASVLPVLAGVQSQFRLEMVLRLRFFALGLTDVVAQICAVSIALVLALRGLVQEAITCQLIGQAAIQLIVVVFVSGWRPSRPGDWASEVRPVLRVGVNLLGISLLREASRLSTVPLIATRLPVSQVGIYDRIQQIAMSPGSAAVDQLQRVMVPVLTRVRSDLIRLERFARVGHLGLTYSAFTAYLVISVLATPITQVVLGSKWGSTGLVLSLLAWGGGFVLLARSMQWLFIGAGQTKASLRLNVWLTPAMVAVALAGLPWGLTGVALGTAIGGLFMWPVTLVTAARETGLRPRGFFLDFFRVFVSWCGPIMGGAWLCSQVGHSYIQQMSFGALGALSAGLIMFVLLPSVRADTRMFVKLLKGS
jgi:PST family polysaccharide transporter